MKNNIDKTYQNLLQDILENGVKKGDRTGIGTLSVFGRQIRHKMSEGFPLLTTKKMYFKGIVTELLWFLRGDTNIKYLVDNDCHIWDGDAYKRFFKEASDIKAAYEEGSLLGTQPEIEAMFSNIDKLIILTKEEFINKVKTDDKFAKKWGDLGPIYGRQWRNWHWRSEPFLPEEKDMIYTADNKLVTWSKEKYTDQIQNLINDLKTNPDSRRLMISVWNVGELDQMVLPPCHYGFQVYTRELSKDERYNLYIAQRSKMVAISEEDFLKYNIPTRAISLIWNQRSVDTLLGLPFNIASYALLLEIIAKEVNMVPEELIGNLGDTHLYLNHIEQTKEQISKTSYKLPKLKISSTLFEFGKPDPNKLNLDYYSYHNFELENYQSHVSIKAPLNN